MAKPLRSQPTRDRILDAARRLFAEEGFDRTTIRTVAAAAGIHASMVMRYYGSKEGLFAAAAKFDLEMPDLTEIPPAEIGKTLIRHFLRQWEAKGDGLPALLRVAVTHEQARARLFATFQEQVVPALAKISGPEDASLLAALLATQTIGLATTRYVLKLPSIVALSEETIVEKLGTAVQTYFSDESNRGR